MVGRALCDFRNRPRSRTFLLNINKQIYFPSCVIKILLGVVIWKSSILNKQSSFLKSWMHPRENELQTLSIFFLLVM